MTIFYPTSTKKFSDVAAIEIDSINLSNFDIVAVQNKTGQVYRIKLTQLGKYISIDYSDLISQSQTQFLVGRYSSGPGPLQEISIGDNISLNYDTGLLDCNLNIVGDAGGVLEGKFPEPQLKESVVETRHIAPIKQKTILGRASLEDGPPEEILLGPEFDLDQETKTLRIVTSSEKLISTGFAVEQKKDGLDFTALPTKFYMVESELAITVDASNFGRLKAGSQFMILNKGTGDVFISLRVGSLSLAETQTNFAHFISDGNGDVILI